MALTGRRNNVQLLLTSAITEKAKQQQQKQQKQQQKQQPLVVLLPTAASATEITPNIAAPAPRRVPWRVPVGAYEGCCSAKGRNVAADAVGKHQQRRKEPTERRVERKVKRVTHGKRG